MNQKEFGELIAKRRKEKNLTQSELAEKLGIASYKTISKWENGIYMPDISLLNDISQILDVSLYELLGGKNENKNDIDNILKNTIENVKFKNKKMNFLKIIIILLSILLIIMSTLLGIKILDDYRFFFTIRPENVKLEKFTKYYSYIDKDNFFTLKIKDKTNIGIEEDLCQKLPLYDTKNLSLVIPDKNKLTYLFGLKENDDGQSEQDINNSFHDNYYTKKSMFIISIAMFSHIANLKSIDFYYNDFEYRVTKELIEEYYDFIKDYYCDTKCEYWNYLLVNKDNIGEIMQKLDDKKFLDEFFLKSKIDISLEEKKENISWIFDIYEKN